MTTPPKTPMDSKDRFENLDEPALEAALALELKIKATGADIPNWSQVRAIIQVGLMEFVRNEAASAVQAAERDTLERAAKEAARLGAAWRAKSEQEQGYMGNVPNKRNLIGRADGANEIVAAIRRLANG